MLAPRADFRQVIKTLKYFTTSRDMACGLSSWVTSVFLDAPIPSLDAQGSSTIQRLKNQAKATKRSSETLHQHVGSVYSGRWPHRSSHSTHQWPMNARDQVGDGVTCQPAREDI